MLTDANNPTGSGSSTLGQFNTDPNGPLDASQIIKGTTEQAYKNWANQQEMMDWAKKQFAKNEGTADTVSKRALDTSSRFGDYAARDQAEYERTYIPAMRQQMEFAQGYTTPERMAANRAGAAAQSQIATKGMRDASERALQGVGVDPSAGRFVGLDAGLDAAAAARSAAAMTKSDRDTEAMGQEYLDRAIKTGAVLPGQSINEAGLGISAGNQAVNAPLAATASGAATMGTPLQWNTQGNDMFKQWLPAAKAQFEAGAQQNRDVFGSNMEMMKFNQKKEQEGSSGAGAAIGAGMGILGTVAGSYFGGPMGGSMGGSLGGMMGGAMGGGGGGGGLGGGSGMTFEEGGRVPGMRRRFDPEGKDYDYDTAEMAGLSAQPVEDDDVPHWPSRDPQTGMLLKGRNHPTFEHGVDVDRREGYGLEMRNGRYYTAPFQKHDDGGMIESFAMGGMPALPDVEPFEVGEGVSVDPYDPMATLWTLGEKPETYDEGESIGRAAGGWGGGLAGSMFGPIGKMAGREIGQKAGGGVGAAVQGHWDEAGQNLIQGTPLDLFFQEGGEVPPEDGNMVPPEASPSGGEEVDDVHAMVSEGEFVMPKDVTSWYGEKFMQKLIEKARVEMSGPKAEGQPAGPPQQAMALSPPSFHSEGARMGA